MVTIVTTVFKIIKFFRDEFSQLLKAAEQVLKEKREKNKQLFKLTNNFSQHFNQRINTLKKVDLCYFNKTVVSIDILESTFFIEYF